MGNAAKYLRDDGGRAHSEDAYKRIHLARLKVLYVCAILFARATRVALIDLFADYLFEKQHEIGSRQILKGLGQYEG